MHIMCHKQIKIEQTVSPEKTLCDEEIFIAEFDLSDNQSDLAELAILLWGEVYRLVGSRLLPTE